MPLMLPNAPQFSLYESNVPATPSANPGTQVNNPAGAANTKNTTWTELIAATTFDALFVIVEVWASNSAATNTSTLLDIGIGAAAAESVIIPDLLAGYAVTAGSTTGGRHYMLPLRIPSGSRISARTASVRTTGSVYVTIKLFGGPRHPDAWWVGNQVTAYGINTADSGGVQVTAGNSGAETATPVAIGTTSSAHECLVLGVQGNITTINTLLYYFDVGIDTSSTSWLVRDHFFLATSTNECMGPVGSLWWPIFASVPSGSVLVVGGECSGTADALDFALYGVS
jgi:hypothetical protein